MNGIMKPRRFGARRAAMVKRYEAEIIAKVMLIDTTLRDLMLTMPDDQRKRILRLWDDIKTELRS